MIDPIVEIVQGATRFEIGQGITSPASVPSGGGTAAGNYDDTALQMRVAAAEGRIGALEGASVSWTNLADLPAAFPPAAHGHAWGDLSGVPAAFPPVLHRHAWAELDDVPASFPPQAHGHDLAQITGLIGVLNEKAAASQIPSTAMIQDIVAALFQSGTHTNATVAYDPATQSLSVTASGAGAAMTEEEVQDIVGALSVQGTGISVIYDDDAGLLRIALAGDSFTSADKTRLDGIAAGATVNAPDAQLRDRATHTGEQPIESITGLQAALNGKMVATTFKTVNGTAITGAGDIVIPAGPAGTSITGVVLTQAAYDALSTAAKNDTTKLYLIAG